MHITFTIFLLSCLGLALFTALKMQERKVGRKLVLAQAREHLDHFLETTPKVISHGSKLSVAHVSLKAHWVIAGVHTVVGSVRTKFRQMTIKLFASAHAHNPSRRGPVSFFLKHISDHKNGDLHAEDTNSRTQ